MTEFLGIVETPKATAVLLYDAFTTFMKKKPFTSGPHDCFRD